jgi:hypothetical protein
MTEEQKLQNLLQEIYESRKRDSRVSAAWLATEAMQELDPDRITQPLIYLAAHLELRQLARQILRKRFEPDEEEERTRDAQHELFPHLQRRYPAFHESGIDPEYVLLEDLTEKDVKFNINRLRSEALAKLNHARALEAWWENHQQKGLFNGESKR